MNNGIIKNCSICGASYGQYKEGQDYSEYWSELSTKDAETKGVCQFCNPKSNFYTPFAEVIMCSYSRPERLPLIKEMLANQTYKRFKFTVIDNTIENKGSAERFRGVAKVKGNPIIFIDDDESPAPDFVEYMMSQYDPNCIKGWFTRIFKNESYWDSIPYSPLNTEVDYVGTGGMILDRKIFDENPELYDIPPEFAKVEDLFLSYLGREKGLKLIAVEPHIKIEVDGKDQFRTLGNYKEEAFRKLRLDGWKLLKDYDKNL
jgi:hypothetical protein